MAKISPAKKAEFAERSKEIKNSIDEFNRKIINLQKDISKNKNNTVNYKKILIANLQMNVISLFLQLSVLSMETMGIKNETYLENARKLGYKFVSLLEEVVGNEVDVPFSEMDDKMAAIKELDDIKRLKLVKKIPYILSGIEEKFGADSKWKWSFVDLAARGAALCKNFTDFKRIQQNQDPRVAGFPERNDLLAFVKDSIRKAADRLREKYEMATSEPVDMKLAVRFLSALMRIFILFNDGESSNNLKKTIKIWEEKLDKDEKEKEEKKRIKGLKA